MASASVLAEALGIALSEPLGAVHVDLPEDVALVNSRNGFFLLGRTPRPRFRWTELVGATVLSFAEAPTPWQCLLTGPAPRGRRSGHRAHRAR